MSELSITKNEYDKSVLIIKFLSDFKLRINNNKQIKNVVFLPEIAGYRITFDYNDIPSEILLSLNKSKFTVKMKVEYISKNEKVNVFTSKSKEDNQEILNKILLQ